MPEVTIVIPVYNAEQYFRRCVDSILNQTCQDFEIVLVDDGSTDGSPALCDEYAERDPRIHVLHQENGGPSAARNNGIDWAFANSDSKWLCYIDIDDWVHPRMLEMLTKAAGETGASIAVCGYAETGGEPLPDRPEEMRVEVRTPRDFYIRHYVGATVPWAKLYSRECFRDRRYPVGRIHEDEYLTYQVLFEQEQLAFVPAPLYAYFYNEQGITKGEWRPQRMDVFGALEQQIRFFRDRGDEGLVDVCLHRYMRNAYGQMMEARTCSHPRDYREEERMLSEKTRELLKQCHSRGCVSFDSDFSVLMEFYPVRTRLYLYYQAALRRLKLRKYPK